MKHIILFLTAIAFNATVSAQSATDNWYFGVYGGINFTSPVPTVITQSPLVTNEGSSSVSDAVGNPLFYTDGISVWNKFNLVMPNGSGLAGGISATQSALVVPLPFSSTMYYIFTVDEIGGPNGFRYSIVDMTLQSGAGYVTVKNSPILSNVTEKLTAVAQTGTGNYWVAVHEWGSNAFYAYNLTATGLQPTPVISNAGIVHTNAQIQNTYGQMKFNSCGNQLAVAAGYLDTVEIFDFDDVTGVVSNAFTLPMGAHVYGLEFSPDGQYLFVSTYDPLATLVQFYVKAGNAAAVLATKTTISSTPDIYGLQLAIDGKIYVCKSFSQFLGVVNDPALAGVACNYVDLGFDLDPNFVGATSALSLPGFVQSYFNGDVNCNVTGLQQHNNNSLSANIFPNPSTGNFVLHLKEINSPILVEVTDAGGRLIERFLFDDAVNKHEFGNDLSQGIYFVHLKNNNGNTVIKICKM